MEHAAVCRGALISASHDLAYVCFLDEERRRAEVRAKLMDAAILYHGDGNGSPATGGAA